MNTLDYIKSILIFLILIFGLVFTLTTTNIIHCNTIGNVWCDAYWSIVGQPRILVAYGSDGLGNAEKLLTILQDREVLGIRAQSQKLEYITTTSYLKNYKMIVVTQAKTISSDHMKMFYDYASQGGILVWTGDAGTSKMPSDKTTNDYNLGSKGPWVRVTKNQEIIDFGSLISAEYVDNLCNYVNCSAVNSVSGYFKPDPNSSIANGIPPRYQMFGDFAIVTPINNTSTYVDLYVDYQTNLISKNPSDKKGLGYIFPIIIRSQLGKNIVYIASPIENLIDSKETRFENSNTGTNIPTTIRKLFEDFFGTAK